VRCSFRLIGRSRVYEVSSEALRRRGGGRSRERERERERERAREGGREGGIRAAKDANPPVELLTTAGGNLCAAVSIFENRESPIIIPLI